MRLASVSVDLDPLRCYYQIHGLGPCPEELTEIVLDRALPRLLELFDRYQLKSTLFVVGSDAKAGSLSRARLQEAAQAGHELGNHSFSHPYDLARQPRSLIEREIADCHAVLRSLHPQGRPPLGFRAPGYELSPDLWDVVEAQGYRYDTSLMPCPPYYLAKLLAMGVIALRGQQSASVISKPQSQLGPTQPYRPDPQQPWRRGQAGMVELPVAVTPLLRLPVIGTFLLLSPHLRSLLLSGMERQPFFNLELHGIDLIDAETDGIPEALRQRQPDLRVPLAQKMAALSETLAFVRARAEMVPLYQIAEQVQRRGQLD